jgi:glycosyltransferase involved in cell wall biosynthesis
MFLSNFFVKKKKKPVILHLVTWYPSSENPADGIFIKRQIQLLAAESNYRHIVIRKNPKPVSVTGHLLSLAAGLNTENENGLQMISLPAKSRLYKRLFWRYQRTIEQRILSNLVRKIKPSLLHLHVVYGFAHEALFIKKQFGVPFIISEHMGPFPFEWLQDKETIIKKPIEAASAVVAVSWAQAKQIESFTGITPVIIPNVVNENEFYYKGADAIKNEKDIVELVFVGIYTEAKGADYLLKVFPYPNCHLNLVGSATPERIGYLTQQVTESGIDHDVKFHGLLSPAALCALYQQSDFYVCSSQWESFGLSVLEALFTGLPALSTNCGGVNDFINSQNGILILNDQKNETLLNGLLQMMATLSSFNRKVIAANVRKDFSKAVIKEKYNKIYTTILQSNTAW